MLATSRAVRRHTLSAALALALATGLAGVAPPAGAAVTTAGVPSAVVRAATADQAPSTTAGGIRVKLFRVTSKRVRDGGSRFKGNLKFRAWNRVSVKGQVNDLCPGDDLWASGWVKAYGRNGRPLTYIVPIDEGGCESEPYDVSYTFRENRAITRIEVMACTRLAGDQGMPTGHGDCRSKNFRNPKVGRR